MPTEESDRGDVPAAPPGTGLRWAVAGLLVIAVVAFYALGLYRYLSWDHVQANLAAWKAAVAENPALSVGVFFLVYVAVIALSLPAAALLTLLAGALFGRWLGTLVASLAATLGAVLSFLACRYVLRDWVRRRFGARLAAIERGVEADGAYYLFTLRLIPVIPFFLINLGMALTPMRVGPFALVSWLGMLPGGFLYANVGTELATLESPAGLASWPVLGSFALLGVAPLALRLLIRR